MSRMTSPVRSSTVLHRPRFVTHFATLLVLVAASLSACAPAATSSGGPAILAPAARTEPSPGPSAAASATVVAAVAADWQQHGEASWYGPKFAGRRTASGEIFDPSQLTAAHRTLPFGTRLRVTDVATGRSVVVRVNDRGPFAHGRIIDLSRAAAERIGLVASGVTQVRITLAGGPEGLRPLRVDPRLNGYDVIVPGAEPGALIVLSSETGLEVIVRAVDLEPLASSRPDGTGIWTSASLAERLGTVATATVESF